MLRELLGVALLILLGILVAMAPIDGKLRVALVVWLGMAAVALLLRKRR